MQFGRDPKADSTNTLRGGDPIPSVLDLLREKRRVDAHEAIFEGFKGIERFSSAGGALLGGIIANSMNNEFHRAISDDFAAQTQTRICNTCRVP